MKNAATLLTLCLLALQAAAAGGGGGKKMVELSVSSPLAIDAKCALARLLVEGKVTSPALLSQVEGFAARKGMFFPTAHLVTYYADIPKLVEKLMNRPAPTSQQFAAAVLAFTALGNYLETEKRTALSHMVSEDDGDAAEATSKKKGGRKKKSAGEIAIPEALFTNKTPATVELAILAAAYAGDVEAKAQVDAVALPGGSILGAKLLYYARAGVPVADDQVAAALAPASHSAPYITSVSPELGDFELLLPKDAYACEALGLLKNSKNLKYLHQMLGHPDLRVQMEAVRALRKIGARESLPFLCAKLNACEWPVLVDLCVALAAMPAKEAVPPLLAKLKKETGRFRLDVTYALSAIAGEQIGQEFKEWEAWWAKQGATFQVNEAAAKAFRDRKRVQDIHVPDLGFFYSLRIYSDHFSYVVDSSNSMKGDKMENLQLNLCSSIDSLRPWVNFTITDFGGVVSLMQRDALTRDKWLGKTRTKVLTHSPGTRMYDAIEAAAGVKGVDTVLVLSDGQPVKGQLNAWPDLYRSMTIMNRHRQLAISTVAFQPSEKAVGVMKQMSHESRGQSVVAN